MKNPADKVEQWDINKLVPYARNSRTHSDEQVAQIAASIKEWGFTTAVLVDEQGGIIAGHGRTLAAQRLNMKEVPVMVAAGWSDAKKRAYIIADNKLALNAGWDNEMLALELGELKDLDFDLDLTGFTADEIAALMPEQIEPGLTDEDAVPELPVNPVTVLGDVWLLGNHRVMCGDSTSIDAVEKLINSTKIDLCYTDPPYGINEKGDRTARKTGLAKNHNLKDFKDDTIDYAVEAYQIVEGVLQVQRQVWWGANYYCHALPQSNNWFVWDKRVDDKMKDTQSDCELAWVKSKWSSVRIFRHLWKGFNKDSERNQPRVHPTQKPVSLAEWSFDYFKEVNTVLDLFGGSGSALIACEKTKRSCFMMEFEPHYCDVIIKRWQEFTGKIAVHADTNKPFAEVTHGNEKENN
jgi:DNA modification methylase